MARSIGFRGHSTVFSDQRLSLDVHSINFCQVFCLRDVARCVVFNAIVLLRLSNHNGVDLIVSCALFPFIVVFFVMLLVLISAASIQMSPATICLL